MGLLGYWSPSPWNTYPPIEAAPLVALHRFGADAIAAGARAAGAHPLVESFGPARFREWACLARLYGPPRVLQPVTLEYLSTH